MIKDHIDKFPYHPFDLKKYLSDYDSLLIILKLFRSESFEEFMKTLNEAVDDGWEFLIGIWALKNVKSIFEEFDDAHIKSVDIGFGVVSNPEIKRRLLKGDIKLFMSDFLCDTFQLVGSELIRKCVTFDQRKAQGKISFKIL